MVDTEGAQSLDANSRVLHEAAALIQRMDNDGDGKIIYLGLAAPGTASSAALWQIRKYTYSGNYVTVVQFADSDNKFNNIWSNRSSYVYG